MVFKMEWNDKMTKFCKHIFMFVILALTINGCGHSSSGSSIDSKQDEISIIETLDVSETALIDASDGGSLLCETENGIKVSLEIPPSTLPKSEEVTLSVKPDSENRLLIKIEPDNLQLENAAALIVAYDADVSEKIEKNSLFMAGANGGLIPLKQQFTDNILNGLLYRLGTFEYGDIYPETPENVLAKSAKDSWQDILTLFNGLVWMGNYYKSQDDIEASKSCFRLAVTTCHDAVTLFSEIDLPEKGEALADYKKKNIKYEYINALSGGAYSD